jgi:DNA-binding transcriptional ArsR family regulator
MYQLTQALFPTRARRAVLEAFFGPGARSATVSELARRADLTPRAVSVEVKRLLAAGVVEVEAEGAADRVRSNPRHPAARALRELLRNASSVPGRSHSNPRPSLAAYGAPLAGVEPRVEMSREAAVVEALAESRRDATLLRILPVVLLKNEADFDWGALLELARKRKLKDELGMMLELTAEVSGRRSLRERATGLADGRRRVARYLPEPASDYERALADQRTPEVTRRWGLRMNMTEESVREFVRKHLA